MREKCEGAFPSGWRNTNDRENHLHVSTGTLNYWHKIITTELDRVEEGTRVRMEKIEKSS